MGCSMLHAEVYPLAGLCQVEAGDKNESTASPRMCFLTVNAAAD